MTTENTDRDAALAVVYRELVASELAIKSARFTLLGLGWEAAANDLGEAWAIVGDLLHDLGAYAGSTGGGS